MKIFYREKNFVMLRLLRTGFYKYFFLTGVLIMSAATAVFAQRETNYAIHANIIFRFIKYINWPHWKKNGDFVIGVADNNPLYEELRTFTINKTVGYQKIVVQKFSSYV